MKNYQKKQENEYGQMIGTPVSNSLAVYLLAENLYGHSATLHDLSVTIPSEEHFKQIWQCVKTEVDRSCWTYLPYPGFETEDELRNALKSHFGFNGATHYLIEVNHAMVGWVGLINQCPADQVIEIGNVYFSHQMKQSTASTEVIYLLVKACFEQGFRRVEWKCDELNQPSKRAALRFGFQYEGTFRQHRIAKGRNRNTAWFSILDEEWPELEKAYLAWLKADNFDIDGQQIKKLKDFMDLYKIDLSK
ncbi:GNAT family N-acetyltransferase [Acinetobacter sp. NIPH 2377]|uniref:GNAT family N-acetyltransferase n=1 Tax=Acinetobacter terrestris TaxID=2529843 RepID=UPI00148F509B|nr:GNAT family protein [Acinetobacter terrestris]NNH35460.1 GNAT family N-acetyltransferase [Acinetobacter terrestris]